MPVPNAKMKITPIGLRYVGIFIAKYEITIAGIAIMINNPANSGNVEFSVMVVANVANPRTIEITAKTVALVLLLVETPPSRIPAAIMINPNMNNSPVNACIPSMNVCARPEYDVTKPASPIAVRPPPGIIRSQLLNSALMLFEYYFILM